MRRASSLPALLLLTPLLLAPAAPAHAAPAPPPVSFTADPADGSSTSPAGGWFLLRARPGSSTRQALVLRNTSSQRTELVLSAVDASTSAAGGASYGLPADEVRRTGRWVVPDEDRVVVEPGGQVVVPFTVDVPETASPGDHLAGLSIAAPSDVSSTGAVQGRGPATSVDLRTRRVIAVQVEVPGDAQPRIDVRGLTAVVRPTGAQLELSLANAGRRLVRGTGVLVLAGKRKEFAVDTFVPGTAIAYPLPWPASLAAGRHEAQVELTHDGRTVRWSGVLAVADDQVRAAERDEEATAAAPATSVPVSGSGPSTALLAAGVVGGVVLALAGQAGLRRLRGRRRAV